MVKIDAPHVRRDADFLDGPISPFRIAHQFLGPFRRDCALANVSLGKLGFQQIENRFHPMPKCLYRILLAMAPAVGRQATPPIVGPCFRMWLAPRPALAQLVHQFLDSFSRVKRPQAPRSASPAPPPAPARCEPSLADIRLVHPALPS